MRRAGAILLAVGVGVMGLLPVAASAQAPPQPQAQPTNPGALPLRQANYAVDGGLLRASFSYRDVLADPALMKKLSNGLPMVIAMRAYLYADGQSTPVQLAPRVCRVVYDLWDDVYRVHISEPGRDYDQTRLLAGALQICTEAQNLPVVQLALLTQGQPYFLGVVVDVNPVSQDMLDQMHRWMSRPTGSTAIGPTNALFGTFVQLFVKTIPTSDKTITFRTQSVTP
jgi:hypothetical protein